MTIVPKFEPRLDLREIRRHLKAMRSQHCQNRRITSKINNLITELAHLDQPEDRAHEKILTRTIAKTMRGVERIISKGPLPAVANAERQSAGDGAARGNGAGVSFQLRLRKDSPSTTHPPAKYDSARQGQLTIKSHRNLSPKEKTPVCWTPSIVPNDNQPGVYLVVEDLGRLGRIWREADVNKTNLETVIEDLLDGQYKNPIGVYGFNPEEGWARDVSEDVAHELRRRCSLQGREIPESINEFVEGPSGRRSATAYPQPD
jgi:hypothetical protein